MTSRFTDFLHEPHDLVLLAATAAAGVAAALAPAGLTGHPGIDAVERAIIAGACTFVGAHGRRWSWITAAALIAIPARGVSLVITLAALVVLVSATAPRRRSKGLGAIGVGLLVNAIFWYGPSTTVAAPLFAFVAIVVLLSSGLPYLRTRRRFALRATLIGITALVLIAAAGAGIVLLLARPHVATGTEHAQAALRAARNGDADSAAAQLRGAESHFGRAGDLVDSVVAAPSQLIPGLAQQVDAVQVAVHQGTAVAATGADLVATADYDDLTYRGRLDLAKVRALAGPTTRTQAQLRASARALDEALRGHLLPPLRSKLDDFADQVDEADRDAVLAGKVLRVTPALFGGDGPRRYLVVFITPAELRGAGGFIGSYAELTAQDGKARLTRSGRIMDLIQAAPEGTRRLDGPADYLHRYGRFSPQDFLQDATFSPDFPSDADVLAQLYPQSGGQPVDGVISVDPTGLAALLKLTGPVTVKGLPQPLSATNAVEVLTRSQYVDLPDEAARGDILTEATKVTFQQLTEGSLPAPRRIADALSPATRDGHLRLWSTTPREQALFTDLGGDGSLAIPSGADGFSLVQQNVGNNKLDAYLQRTVTYQARVDARTGELRAKVRIELRNDLPRTDLPVAVVGNSRGLPVGTNVATLAFYTRQSVQRATIDGKAVGLGPDRELGLNVFDTPILRIPPKGRVTVTLDLVGGVDLDGGYRFRYVPQPVANPDEVAAQVTFEHGSGGDRTVTLLDGGQRSRPADRTVAVGG